MADENITEGQDHKTEDKERDLTVKVKSAIQRMISEDKSISDAISNSVREAVEPLKAEVDNWSTLIQTNNKGRQERDLDSKGQILGAARFIRAMAWAKGDLDKAKYFANKTWEDDDVNTIMLGSMEKALQAGTFTAGGALIPDPFAPGLIEALRARTVVRAAGARTLPMNNGRLTLRKQTGVSTTTYVGEGQNIVKTEPTSGQIVLTAKKLAAIVPISNDLLRFDADITADTWVRDDLVMQMAIREDQAFIRDTGTVSTPKGLRYWAASANITATNGVSAANVELDFKELIDALEGSDVRMERAVWLMNPRSKNHLLNLRDTNGNLVYPEVRNPTPTVYGFPIFTTTTIPKNLGGGTASEVYFVDMVHAVIGESAGLMVDVDSSASYVESNTLVSAFSRDETVVRVIAEHDFAVRHEEAIAIKTGVTWGA
jgi:HK97 family phage major capsid protein